jgi:hypothetical protein
MEEIVVEVSADDDDEMVHSSPQGETNFQNFEKGHVSMNVEVGHMPGCINS